MKAKAKNWKKAAKAKPRKGSSFGPADVPDGQYEAAITAKCGIGEKGKLLGKTWVELIATISDGEHKGKEPKQFYVLEGKPVSDDPTAQRTAEEKMVGDLKQILPDIDIEGTMESEPEQLEAIIKEVNDRGITMKIGVRNTTGKAGTPTAGKKFQDVYFNEVLSTTGDTSGEEESGETGEEEAGEEADEEEGGEVEEEEGGEPDSDEAVAPAKDDEVMFQPKGGKKRKFIVKTVNQGKRTVTISDGTKKFSDISWDKLEAV
jgi:hypothetical protein